MKIKFSVKNSKSKKSLPAGGRITKDTIEDYRKEVISEGRKFKYPMQYSKNKLVYHTVIISLLSLFIVAFFFMWQLYIIQNTGTLFYRITQVVPLPVAMVEGKQVRYSDYLMQFRGEKHFLESFEDANFSTKDGQRQLDVIKNRSMDSAVTNAYAAKLARNMNIKVTQVEVNNYISAQQKANDKEVSDKMFAATLNDFYGWSIGEYKHVTQQRMLTQKVKYAVDKDALTLAKEVRANIDASPESSLEEIANKFGNKVKFSSTGGMVPKDNQDGGLAALALSQDKGQVSSPTEMATGDAFYIVKTIDKTDAEVSYEYISVPLKQFDKQLRALREEGKVRYFIAIKPTESAEIE